MEDKLFKHVCVVYQKIGLDCNNLILRRRLEIASNQVSITNSFFGTT